MQLTPQKLERRGYRTAKISWCFLYESPVWRTDRRTFIRMGDSI